MAPVSEQTPQSVLQQRFGLSEFREGQLEIIEHLLAGRSAAAVFPTGGGKSLCYQLPALLLEGLTLVVSPLIALMKDQIDALTARGINAKRLDSSLGLQDYRRVMDEIRNGELRILYVAPERFNNERFRASLAKTRIALFAIDEAHCISEWGHNFRPDYLKLVNYAKEFKAERVLALTATATRDVQDDICRVFDITPECAVNTGFYRSNLSLQVHGVSALQRDQLLLDKLASRPRNAAIIYVTLQKTAERVAGLVSAAGFPARHYHAGMKDEERSDVQDWFIQSDSAIVVATIAFGMGIDKSDIRRVYHYNLPKSLENYAQEIGRAGRDGKSSQCIMMAASEDLIPLENFVYGDTPTHRAIQIFVESVFTHDDSFDISQYELSQRCDVRALVLKTLLTQLELKGYLTAGTPFYANYQFKFLVPEDEVLNRFEGERKVFLEQVFANSDRRKVWSHIDLHDTARQLSEDRSRIVKAFEYLEQQGLIEVKVAGVRNRYQIVQRPVSTDALVEELFAASQLREEREIARLRNVVDWIELDRCQSSALAQRFDRPLDTDCGHCSWCETGEAALLPSRIEPAVESVVLDAAKVLQKEYARELPTAIELTRVLCGISSPAISKARLQRHKLFGVLVDVPYRTVLGLL